MNQREKCRRIQEKESCNISVVWRDAGERRGPLLGAAQEGAGDSQSSGIPRLWKELNTNDGGAQEGSELAHPLQC